MNILEGGNVGRTNSTIPKELVEYTADKVLSELKFNGLKRELLGNIHKPYVGDIDIGMDINELIEEKDELNTDTFWEDIKKYLENLNSQYFDTYKIMKGFDQFSVVVPLLDKNGNHLNASDRQGNVSNEKAYVQVDIMFGNLDFMSQAMKTFPNSAYSSTYRNVLLADILGALIYHTKGSEVKKKLQINLKKGLQIVDFIEKNGKKEKLKIKTLSSNLDKLAKFLFNKSYNFEKIGSFEDIYDAFQKDFRFPKYKNEILNRFKKSLESRKLPIPDNLKEGVKTMSEDIKKILEDSEFVILLLNESIASKKAKKLGLKHLGFGNYGPDKDGPATHKSKNGRLIKVKSAKSTKKVSDFDNIRNIRKVKGDDQMFMYTIGDTDKKIRLSKEEYSIYVNKSKTIRQIIVDKLKEQEAKKKKTWDAKPKKANNNDNKDKK